jgi:hypothetical protein
VTQSREADGPHRLPQGDQERCAVAGDRIDGSGQCGVSLPWPNEIRTSTEHTRGEQMDSNPLSSAALRLESPPSDPLSPPRRRDRSRCNSFSGFPHRGAWSTGTRLSCRSRWI